MDIFPGCEGKGTNIVVRVDSKLFGRQNKPASGQAGQRTNILQIYAFEIYGNQQQNNFY